MKTKKLHAQTALAAALLAAIGAVSAAILVGPGAILDKECVKGNCAGTQTAYSGRIILYAEYGSKSVGTQIGHIEAGFDSSLWGGFTLGAYSGGALEDKVPLYMADAAAALPGFPCSGTGMALIGSGALLHNDVWDDLGFSLAGTYYCLTEPQSNDMVLSIGSPGLGWFGTFTGGVTVNNLQFGLSFNGVGILSRDANNVEGLRQLIAYTDGDPLTGTKSLTVFNNGLTKYDFNVDIGKNVTDVTRPLRPWTYASVDGTAIVNGPAYLGGWNGSVTTNGLDLTDIGNGPSTFNYDSASDVNRYASQRNSVIWFDLQGAPCSGFGGNAACAVKVDGAEPTPLPGFFKSKVEGRKTVIVEGGNLYIASDMYYASTGSLAVFVVRRDRNDPTRGGNVYVDPRVTNVVGAFIIDGAFMNLDVDGTVLSTKNPAHAEKLRRQLLIQGSIASANSIGSSFTGTSALCSLDGLNCTCPYGTDWEKQRESKTCTHLEAAKYDLAALRKFTLRGSALAGGQPDTFECDDGVTMKLVPSLTDVEDWYDEVTYAWAGKKKCYPTDPEVVGLGTTDKANSMVIEFNKAILSSDLPILRKKFSN